MYISSCQYYIDLSAILVDMEYYIPLDSDFQALSDSEIFEVLSPFYLELFLVLQKSICKMQRKFSITKIYLHFDQSESLNEMQIDLCNTEKLSSWR